MIMFLISLHNDILGAFVGLDRGSKFSITDILDRDANDTSKSLDAAVETRRRE